MAFLLRPRRILSKVEAKVDSYDDRAFLRLAMLLYVAFVTVTIFGHEIWFDEMQHWLIAKDSCSLSELFHNLRYDGRPTLTNEEMLYEAYWHYHVHRKNIELRRNVSAHRQPAKMGVIKLLKWMS